MRRDIGPVLLEQQMRALRGRGAIGDGRDVRDVDLDALDCILGQRPALRHDDGQRLADEPHLVRGDDRLDETLEPFDGGETDRDGRDDRADVGCGEDRRDAGTSPCRAQCDVANSAVRHGTAHDGRVQQAFAREIGNETAAPGQQPGVLDPLDRLTDIGVRPHGHRGRVRDGAHGSLDGINGLGPRLPEPARRVRSCRLQ